LIFFLILSFNIELVGRQALKYFLNCFLLGYIGLMNMITSFSRLTKIDFGLFFLFILILDLLGIVLYNFLNLLYIWLFRSNNPSRGFEEFIHVDSSFFNWILLFFPIHPSTLNWLEIELIICFDRLSIMLSWCHDLECRFCKLNRVSTSRLNLLSFLIFEKKCHPISSSQYLKNVSFNMHHILSL